MRGGEGGFRGGEGDWIWSRWIDARRTVRGRKEGGREVFLLDRRPEAARSRAVGQPAGIPSTIVREGTKGGSPGNGGLVGASLRLARAGDTAF